MGVAPHLFLQPRVEFSLLADLQAQSGAVRCCAQIARKADGFAVQPVGRPVRGE
jgi:hypothetical protein